MKIHNTKDQDKQHINVLVCGASGSGKTTFIGSSHVSEKSHARTPQKTLILSAESGLLSVKEKAIDYIPINQFQDMIDAWQFLATEKHEYTTVGIDSLTEIQQICMDAILQENEREKPQISDWGTLNNRMIAMIRKFRDLPLNIVVSCLVRTVEDEETMSTKIVPQLQGSIRDMVPAYFDEVFYLFAKENKDGDIVHHMLTHGHDKVQFAKDRSGMLDKYEAPDFWQIHSKIFKTKRSK